MDGQAAAANTACICHALCLSAKTDAVFSESLSALSLSVDCLLDQAECGREERARTRRVFASLSFRGCSQRQER